MSLIRQIWLLVLGAVVLALVGSVGVSTHTLRDLLQTQLAVKNNDNANALALAMSQQQGDVELMSLLVSAQFDGGAYESLRWRDQQGRLVYERRAHTEPQQAPAWFVQLLPIQAAPGLAKVSNGWSAIGEVEVRSHTGYVHDALWNSLLHSTLWLVAVGLVASVMAKLVLQRLRRPVDAAVAQADALVQGRFEAQPEPDVPEMKRLGQAMNTMVARVQQMFEGQAEQLRQLHQQLLCDPLTGVTNRAQFVAELNSALHRDDAPLRGALLMARVRDLSTLNHVLGRQSVDVALQTLAQALQVYHGRVNGCLVGRLNGSDFALWLPVPDVAQETAEALSSALHTSLLPMSTSIRVALGVVELPRQRPLSAWLSAADAALAQAEQSDQGVKHVISVDVTESQQQGERAWRQHILEALSSGQHRIIEYPLLDRQGRLLHLECPMQLRLQPEGPFEPAARWLPLAVRSRLSADADLHAVQHALTASAGDGQRRGINVAPATLSEDSFLARLRALLQEHSAAATLLDMELAQAAVLLNLEAMQELSRLVRPLGVRLGVEHAGAELTRVERLYAVGLDYVKLDSSVCAGVAVDSPRAAFARSMVALLHSLDLQVYAEGVREAADAQVLWESGFDGVTGPWATAHGNTAKG
ncbi:EAL domain-containing protein [Roseateles sp. BYS180W]|uniref:EAL domain-containing protein n=1 Tax=Roseateles rivi TaxID=3299028 RepID=A0ABW7FYA2_9BURK